MLQRLVGCFGVFDTVCHSLSKYCCISSGEQHIMVSPFADSWRALFIFLRSDGVIVCSDVLSLVCIVAPAASNASIRCCITLF